MEKQTFQRLVTASETRYTKGVFVIVGKKGAKEYRVYKQGKLVASIKGLDAARAFVNDALL